VLDDAGHRSRAPRVIYQLAKNLRTCKTLHPKNWGWLRGLRAGIVKAKVASRAFQQTHNTVPG
jgi:hypothetical protein